VKIAARVAMRAARASAAPKERRPLQTRDETRASGVAVLSRGSKDGVLIGIAIVRKVNNVTARVRSRAARGKAVAKVVAMRIPIAGTTTTAAIVAGRVVGTTGATISVGARIARACA
jgi:hypothetical protein